MPDVLSVTDFPEATRQALRDYRIYRRASTPIRAAERVRQFWGTVFAASADDHGVGNPYTLAMFRAADRIFDETVRRAAADFDTYWLNGRVSVPDWPTIKEG